MQALETIQEEINARVPPINPSEQLLKLHGFSSNDQVKVVREVVERIGSFERLAQEIETAIDEDALMARAREEERKVSLSEEYGERAREKEEEEEIAVRAEGDEMWGQARPWVVKEA
jgi:hypothetical protein